jgi:hypothetical protein
MLLFWCENRSRLFLYIKLEKDNQESKFHHEINESNTRQCL